MFPWLRSSRSIQPLLPLLLSISLSFYRLDVRSENRTQCTAYGDVRFQNRTRKLLRMGGITSKLRQGGGMEYTPLAEMQVLSPATA